MQIPPLRYGMTPRGASNADSPLRYGMTTRGASNADSSASLRNDNKGRHVPPRIVLSRKGFDSAACGCASPILDGRLISLPIPEPGCRPRACHTGKCHPGHVRYRELGEAAPGVPLATLVRSLTRGRVRGNLCAHLDRVFAGTGEGLRDCGPAAGGASCA